MEHSPTVDKQKARPLGEERREQPRGSRPAGAGTTKPADQRKSTVLATGKRVPRPEEKEPQTHKHPDSSARGKAKKPGLAKHLSPLAHTRMMAKKAIRNLILYPVAIVSLYPVLVFRHSIYLLVLYLFIWANIVLAVAVFLDEWLDLPRKQVKPPRRRRIFAPRDQKK